MDFDLTEDQKEIKRVAHELLAARSPWAKVRAAAEAGTYDAALSSELVELGWPGIAVSEDHGGQGLGTIELAVLAEELGYACAVDAARPARRRGAGDRRGRKRCPTRALAPGIGVRGDERRTRDAGADR